MGRLSKVRADAALERDGVWATFYTDPEGKEAPIRVRLRRLNMAETQLAFAKLLDPVKDRVRNGTLGHEERSDILAPALAEHVLIDWDGITEEDGTTLIPYSREKALELLRDPSLREFRDFVMATAGTAALYRQQQEAAAAKN